MSASTLMRRPGALRTLLPLSLLVWSLAACGDPAGPGTEPIDELPRALTSSERAVIASSNAFGFDLMGEVLERDDRANVVLSPLSASVALGMTLNGAATATFDGMRAALRFEGLSQEEINAAYGGLLELLGGLDRSVELAIANSVWANEEYTFRQPFLDAVTQYFDAELQSRSFADPATLAAINGWAEDRTNGYIDRILDELSPDQAMILLNAVYFDGRWTTRFDPDETRPSEFTREDGSVVTVPMMNMREVELPFGTTDELVAVELPYGGGAFTMVLAVPWGQRPDAARELLAGMDAAAWDGLISSLTVQELDALALPRFTLSYDVLLTEPLSAMGMEAAFTPRADFSNLSPTPLCLDFVRQKTFIEVDEAGTKAAAVTAVGAGPVSFTGLIADQPFIFAIRERLSGTVLFMGLVGDPTLEDSGPADDWDPCAMRR